MYLKKLENGLVVVENVAFIILSLVSHADKQVNFQIF